MQAKKWSIDDVVPLHQEIRMGKQFTPICKGLLIGPDSILRVFLRGGVVDRLCRRVFCFFWLGLAPP